MGCANQSVPSFTEAASNTPPYLQRRATIRLVRLRHEVVIVQTVAHAIVGIQDQDLPLGVSLTSSSSSYPPPTRSSTGSGTGSRSSSSSTCVCPIGTRSIMVMPLLPVGGVCAQRLSHQVHRAHRVERVQGIEGGGSAALECGEPEPTHADPSRCPYLPGIIMDPVYRTPDLLLWEEA